MKIGMNLPVMVPGLDRATILNGRDGWMRGRTRVWQLTTSDPDEVYRVADILS